MIINNTQNIFKRLFLAYETCSEAPICIDQDRYKSERFTRAIRAYSELADVHPDDTLILSLIPFDDIRPARHISTNQNQTLLKCEEDDIFTNRKSITVENLELFEFQMFSHRLYIALSDLCVFTPEEYTLTLCLNELIKRQKNKNEIPNHLKSLLSRKLTIMLFKDVLINHHLLARLLMEFHNDVIAVGTSKVLIDQNSGIIGNLLNQIQNINHSELVKDFLTRSYSRHLLKKACEISEIFNLPFVFHSSTIEAALKTSDPVLEYAVDIKKVDLQMTNDLAEQILIRHNKKTNVLDKCA